MFFWIQKKLWKFKLLESIVKVCLKKHANIQDTTKQKVIFYILLPEKREGKIERSKDVLLQPFYIRKKRNFLKL